MSAVILSMGDRPHELDEAVRSVAGQSAIELETIIVWNGVDAADGPPATHNICLPENVGIPAARNIGAFAATGEFVLFLDDDAVLLTPDVLARAIDVMRAGPAVDVVGLRIVDEFGDTARRHVPRLRSGTARRSGFVAGFLGGACVVRRDRFVAVGGFDGSFFYAMEETDLALRMIDTGTTIWYDADLRVQHPRTVPGRHTEAVERTARNRVWLAYRDLPAAIGAWYVVNWLLIGAFRAPRSLGASWRGTLDGLKNLPDQRRPIRWSTVWKLVRLGRPPLL